VEGVRGMGISFLEIPCHSPTTFRLSFSISEEASGGGEAHHDNRMEFDHENHEIQEVMDQGPHRPKLDPNGLRARPPGLLFGLASPL
jgi:hypothetical protein